MYKKPASKGPLGVYRLLSKSGAVRVSPLCFGAMNLGEAWAENLGPVDKKASFELLDHFFEQGGNFIDTANNYQEGESERVIGEWMEERGVRDQIVLATKFTSPYHNEPGVTRVNYAGNTRKSLHVSVKDSLKKLRTDYIDLLYVHWWDYTVTVQELMPALDALVRSGQVLYLGISDAPAWVVAKANQYARDHGMSQFVAYQGRWAVSERDMERDIIPMCKDEDMALVIWGALGSGKYKTQEQIDERQKSGEKGRNLTQAARAPSAADKAAVAVLERVSKETGFPITSVAMAWVMAKEPYVFPIVGGRKVEHLTENIHALTLALTAEQIKALDAAVPFHAGFPFNFFAQNPADNFLLNLAGEYQFVGEPKAIAPKK